MQTIILVPLIFLFFLQSYCKQENNVSNINVANNSSNTFQNGFTNSNKPNNSTTNSPDKLSQPNLIRYENIVYVVLLRSIYHSKGQYKNFGENAFDGMNGFDVLCYRKQTISPNSLDELENNPKISQISQETIDYFKQAIQKPKDLLEGYDVKAPLKIVSGNRDLEKLFPKAYKEHTETIGKESLRFKVKAIVGLSRIGFNRDMSQALVYVEYFSPTKKLQKLYVIMRIHNISDTIEPNLEISENDIMTIQIAEK